MSKVEVGGGGEGAIDPSPRLKCSCDLFVQDVWG